MHQQSMHQQSMHQQSMHQQSYSRPLTACRCRCPCCRYDPDEIEEEQRERERRNQINRQFNQYVKRVQQDIWERDYGCAAAAVACVVL